MKRFLTTSHYGGNTKCIETLVGYSIHKKLMGRPRLRSRSIIKIDSAGRALRI
jgi:hypothetical protein